VLARHDSQVVLVREAYPAWGSAHWNIPSGRVEDHETPSQGASRELAEETGLLVGAADMVLVGTSSVVSPGRVSRAWTFTAVVEDPSLDVRDPDGLIHDARWFPVEQAEAVLRQLPYRPLSEPSVALLRGDVETGCHWAYPGPDAPPIVTFPRA
jgi:8-oxo-dGTP diphosphatase